MKDTWKDFLFFFFLFTASFQMHIDINNSKENLLEYDQRKGLQHEAKRYKSAIQIWSRKSLRLKEMRGEALLCNKHVKFYRSCSALACMPTHNTPLAAVKHYSVEPLSNYAPIQLSLQLSTSSPSPLTAQTTVTKPFYLLLSQLLANFYKYSLHTPRDNKLHKLRQINYPLLPLLW